jgi:lysophospholipase L1-like esterase
MQVVALWLRRQLLKVRRMDSSPNLQLPYLIAAQAQKHVTHNEALKVLDAVVHLLVLDKDLASPPGTPADGDCYIVAASPTGAWDGHAGSVAAYQDGAWAFYTPREGWHAWVADEDKLYAYSGSAWAEFANPGVGAPLWGINTTADATNRLAVESPASLFDNVGNGHQLKINKAAAGDTASTLYQTGHSGRAELGLTGDDDFHLKVSADGSAWTEALAVDRTTGAVDVKKSLLAQDHLIGMQATGPRIVAVGDSLTVGSGASAAYTSLITYPTWNGQSFTVSNVGVNGRSLQDMARLAYSNLNPLFANESGLNIAVVWGGINDLASLGASPEDTYSRLRAFCGRLRAMCWRVVVCTLVSRVTYDAQRATFNGYVRGDWPLFADALADLGANANIGASGAHSNATYFQADGIHLTDAGLAIVAGLVQAELTTLAQSTPNWFPPFGNVGIGTSSPAVSFHVRKAGFPAARVESTDNTTGSAAAMTTIADWGQVQFASHCSARTTSRFGITLGGWAELLVQNNAGATNGLIIGAQPNVPIVFGTNNAERARIDGSGNCGIGTSSPAVLLDVNGPVRVSSYTVAAVPPANAAPGQLIYVSDEAGGAVLAFSDGTDWRRATDRAVIS